MKKILLIIVLIMAIFQMVVLATAIDIGDAVTNRGSHDRYYTNVTQVNPANASGKITSIEIWCETDMTGVKVATFFVVSGNNLSTRDSESIPGTIVAGAKRTYTVDLDVEEGDYLGYYNATGYMEVDYAASTHCWAISGDYIPCTNQAFDGNTDEQISLYGTGATVEAPTGNAILLGINF